MTKVLVDLTTSGFIMFAVIMQEKIREVLQDVRENPIECL